MTNFCTFVLINFFLKSRNFFSKALTSERENKINRRQDTNPSSVLQFLELLVNQFPFWEKKKSTVGFWTLPVIFQTVPGIILSHPNNKHPHSRREPRTHISGPWLPLKKTHTHHKNTITDTSYMFTSLFWEQCEICNTINTVTALLIKFSKLLIKVLCRIISSKTPNLMHDPSRPNESHNLPDIMLTICSVKCNHSYPEGLLLFSLSQ